MKRMQIVTETKTEDKQRRARGRKWITRGAARDSYPESYITKYASVRGQTKENNRNKGGNESLENRAYSFTQMVVGPTNADSTGNGST